ncbi:MAG: hypothetical protein OXN21_03905 [Chloroflexota bacterium]|nr:hypothetical protein [Chloroflexota bacterium]
MAPRVPLASLVRPDRLGLRDPRVQLALPDPLVRPVRLDPLARPVRLGPPDPLGQRSP